MKPRSHSHEQTEDLAVRPDDRRAGGTSRGADAHRSASAALKRQWDGIALNLKESAEVVPADRYSFKPSPDVKTFAGEMGHAANTHYFFCARIKGEANPNKADYEKETSKDVLVKARDCVQRILFLSNQWRQR